jgi:hypothetical protein
MPFSGGVFTRLYNWVADKNAVVPITALRMDGEDDGFAAAINAVVSQTQPFVGPVTAPVGTVSLPGLTFDGDTNTGLYRKSADVIGVAAGGANAIDFTSAGLRFTASNATIDVFDNALFTPTIAGKTTAGVGTYSAQTGYYIRIGRAVLFHIRLGWTAHTGTGNMEVRGLPFASDVTYDTALSALPGSITVPAGETFVASVNASASTIQLGSVPLVGGGVTDLAIDAVGTVSLSGWYRVA